MRKLFLLISFLVIAALSSFSQNESTEAALVKAIEYLKNKGFDAQQSGNNIKATSGEESFDISVVTLDYAGRTMPVFIISTELRSYSCQKNNPLSLYELVNTGNLQIPFYKITLGLTYAGALSLVEPDLEENDVVGGTVYGSFTTFYETDDQLLFLLDDTINTFRNLRTNLPESLENY